MTAASTRAVKLTVETARERKFMFFAIVCKNQKLNHPLPKLVHVRCIRI